MDISRYSGRAQIRTAQLKWYPESSKMINAFRRSVNRMVPHLRQGRLNRPSWDGPLHTKIPETVEMHGDSYVDEYKYMEDLHGRETLNAVKLEQKHFFHMNRMWDLPNGKHRMWSELDTRVVISTREGGFDKGEERIGDHIYYTKALEKDSTEIAYYRKRVGETDLLSEELINPLVLQKQFGYPSCNVGICRVSENGKMIGYTLSVEGGDRYICHVRTVDNSSIFHIIRSSNIVSIEFGSSNNFFYTECNELNRPYRVMMQELRPGLLPDPIEVYRDDDEEFFVDVRKTKDGKYIVISSDAKMKGNVCVIPSSFPVIPKALKPFFEDGKPVEIAGKEAWGWLEHHGKHFVMVTSADGSENFKVCYIREEMALADKKKAVWTDFIPHNPKSIITDVDIFRTHFIAFETTLGFEKSSQIRVAEITDGVDKASDRSKDVLLHFPPLSYVVPGLNRNFVQDSISFTYSNIVTPARECNYYLKSQLKPEEVRYSSPFLLYTTRQHELFSPWDYLWPYHMYRDVATSADGTDIPMTICQKRDVFVDEITDWDPAANSPRNCLLVVYGAYGESIPLHFQLAPYIWLIRRRWVVAFAHVRGGGEFPGWAEAGRGPNKHKTCEDFAACCQHLIDTGITDRTKLVVAGSSAGAVPIAATANTYGNSLFSLAFLRAPFLDIINTMKDTSLPLSLAERQDWGDPTKKEDYEYMKKYDPYLNLTDKVRYPAMVISTNLDDDRVPAWNALKFIAKLRAQRAKDPGCDPIAAPLIMRCNSTGGHYVWGDTLQLAEEMAMLCQLYDIPGPYQKPDDLDTQTMINNFFDVGLMDHDDQHQTFLKWEAWEHERVDFQVKMHRMQHEPNFRILAAKKDPYYWDKVEPDPEMEKPPTDPNARARDYTDVVYRNLHSRKVNLTGADRKK